uniref:Neuropathy target esterase sws n=2 Tax=Hirondellea gigas TaxID=1518452 RepID=A0A6A7FP55_9CRUS
MEYLYLFNDYLFGCMGSFKNVFEYYVAEYPVAFPLTIVAVVALLVLVFCRLRQSSPEQIRAEIKREIRNKVADVKDFVGVGTRPRFRKRDKIYFYGRKMLRKVKANIPGHDGGRARRLARRLLLGKADRDLQLLQVVEPPPEYLQEDVKFRQSHLPHEFVYMLRNIRLFSHFDTPMFLELCKSLQTVSLKRGQALFSIGDSDEFVYMVQSGRVVVTVQEADGNTRTLKEAVPGETVLSLLSFCDVLTGQKQPYKTVAAYAAEDSLVMKFPVEAVQNIFQQHPDMFVRVVQIVMARLMRVTFTALHHYLGLSSELINRVPRRIGHATLSSPSKIRSESMNSTGSGEDKDCSAGGADDTGTKAGGGRRIVLVDPRHDDADHFINIAISKFQSVLQLPSDEMLKGQVEVRDLEAGDFIMKQDSMQNIALVYVLTGSLQLSQHPPEGITNNRTCGGLASAAANKTKKTNADAGSSGSSSSNSTPRRQQRQHSSSSIGGADEPKEVHMFTAQPGDLVGGLAVLSGDPSFFTVRASHQSRVATISKATFYSILQSHPKVALHVASTVIMRMSPFVRQIDFALDWEYLEAGRALYRQGERTNATYIVLSGRLRSVITHSCGRKEVVSEYGKGELVGIVELLTDSERSTTVMAVRDSELARLPEGLFEVIKHKHPIVMARLIKLLGHRIIGSWQSTVSREPLNLSLRQSSSNSSYSTVAILPCSEDVPITQFTLELYHSLHAIGTTARLTSDYIVRSLGTSIWEAGNEHQLISWLGHVEDQHNITLYQCDASLTVWTQRCIRQADVILTVGLATANHGMGKLEHHVELVARRTQKVLVLLHRQDGPPPKGTVHWLNARSYCTAHHHIRAPHRMFHARNSHSKILEYYKTKVLMAPANVHSDFSRLARALTGTSVGLVLGGGGARGAAHIGMIKALQEAGVPIDVVAGVSIGALFGALYCLENDLASATQKARQWSMKMSSKWRLLLELTYPIVSMFSGAGFNMLLREVLGETNIEDLWLPYFTLTTDITDSTARIHTHGSAWRYVRASMSLSGYMPPLCDPTDGHLLLDGGYVNNLPADVLRQKFNVGSILAVDVGSTFDSDFTNYGDQLSGFDLLFRRTFPFKYFYRSEMKVPNLYDIQTRLSYVTCTRQLQELKASDYCEYIRPPIDKFQTLQFNLFDEVKEVGYQHGRSYFSGMSKSGRKVVDIYRLRRSSVSEQSAVTCLNPASVGYTDLAQVVCNAKKNGMGSVYDSSTEDDYEELQEGYNSEPNTNTRFYRQTHVELSSVRYRRTGSLSDNEFLDLVNGDPALDDDDDDDDNDRGEEKLENGGVENKQHGDEKHQENTDR